MSASALAANPILHARSKHIELDFHFLRDKVIGKHVVIHYVPSIDQIADIMTKGLCQHRFLVMRSKLNVAISPLCLRRDDKDKDSV